MDLIDNLNVGDTLTLSSIYSNTENVIVIAICDNYILTNKYKLEVGQWYYSGCEADIYEYSKDNVFEKYIKTVRLFKSG